VAEDAAPLLVARKQREKDRERETDRQTKRMGTRQTF
jgi:hypothetical protein